MVDDSENDVFFAKYYYERTGLQHPFVHLPSGTHAVAHFEAVLRGDEPRPAFVLLDINMPRLNGFETLARLNDLAISPPLIVVMLTTTARLEEKERALALGAREFHTKPMLASGYVEIFKGLVERLV